MIAIETLQNDQEYNSSYREISTKPQKLSNNYFIIKNTTDSTPAMTKHQNERPIILVILSKAKIFR